MVVSRSPPTWVLSKCYIWPICRSIPHRCYFPVKYGDNRLNGSKVIYSTLSIFKMAVAAHVKLNWKKTETNNSNIAVSYVALNVYLLWYINLSILSWFWTLLHQYRNQLHFVAICSRSQPLLAEEILTICFVCPLFEQLAVVTWLLVALLIFK